MAEKGQAAGDAPAGKKRKTLSPEPEEPQLTESQMLKEENDRTAQRRNRFKKRWPEVTKVILRTRPWRPPGPPKKPPRVEVEYPELTKRRWVPAYLRRRRPRPKLLRVPKEEMTKPLYDCAKLNKIWHNFGLVEKNKMMLQGSIACNSKKYSATHCGAQTACIAVMCKALLEEKDPSQLVKSDVDYVIDAGDRFYRQCMVAMKCYKGNPKIELKQLMNSFFFNDTKYSVKMSEVDRGVLARHPDSTANDVDFMALMEKRIGSTFALILTVGDKHFFVWGHPPAPEAGSQVKTVCYIFDPHMLDRFGMPHKLYGSGAFLRFAGISCFVVDFLANYGEMEKKNTPKPAVTLTEIEVLQSEPLQRLPAYDLDMKIYKFHCKNEWETYNWYNLIEKRHRGEYPFGSLSAVSLATTRVSGRNKVNEFYNKIPKEPMPSLPIPPEKGPVPVTNDQLMQIRGENFFLYCPKGDQHTYGRDDLIPLPGSATVLYSPVEIAEGNFPSQFKQLDVEKWILRATRHMASYRYQKFQTFTAIACCVAALAILRRLRARAWNEDLLDESLDVGFNLYRDSLEARTGPIRRLVLGEIKENFNIRDKEFTHKDRGIAVWGKLLSNNPNILDLCRGIEAFFRESDAGILQVPGEFETAIWHEGGRYYVYHPWPADKYGHTVGLQDGGRACLLAFGRINRLCEYFLDCVRDLKRKPFSIADVYITERKDMPEPVNNFKTVAPNRWVIRGSFHEADARFPEDHRGKQATPASIAAIAMAHIVDPGEWTQEEIDESLVRGDILYQATMEHRERLNLNAEPDKNEEEAVGEETQEKKSSNLAAIDVLNRFKVSEYDCIESDVVDSAYTGTLHGGEGVMSLKESLRQMFKEHSHGIINARGGSTAVWRHDDHLYFFDPHGCDENGYLSEELTASACLVRVKGSVDELADIVEGNLSPGSDDTFTISPVAIVATKLNADLGAPETNLESKSFQWISKGTAAIMPGPRGENSALGKAVDRAGIKDDFAGRTIALPAAAAFAAAAHAVPPPHMHQDHMFNFLDAGAEYYLNHLKKTGRKEVLPEDLTEKFEMGANTFSIQLGEPIRLPLRLPDKPTGEGAEEEEDKEYGEGEEEEERVKPLKEISEALFAKWADTSSPTTLHLLVGDYHQLGVWMSAGGKVVAFDPAPTLAKGMLTVNRIIKGDELRMQRIKDEMAGEGGEGAAEDEEAGAEGEEQPEPAPEFVPPEATPALMVFASPREFIDKLVFQGGLNFKQTAAPYKLYPVTVTNELTSLVKDKIKDTSNKGEEEEEEGSADVLIKELSDEAMGKYFTRLGRSKASLRGKLAQGENFFMEKPNRDNQDAANSIMAICVEHIEPYIHWKPALIDAILKYGDRLYTMSLPNARNPPRVGPGEMVLEFHVTNFNVRIEVANCIVNGDIKAGESGNVMSIKRGLAKFFEDNKHGVVCAKDYCVGVWQAHDNDAFCYFDPHAVGPAGKSSPGGAAGIVLFSTLDEMADTIKANLEGLGRPGTYKYCISAIRVFWEFQKTTDNVTAQGAVPDEGYEWKVLTAYLEIAKGRTILRGSRPVDSVRFAREALIQSSASAVVAGCMSHVRRPHLWTRNTVDEIMSIANKVFADSLNGLGYEFRPGDDVLLPLQVVKRFLLGVNFVRYNLNAAFSGKLEQLKPAEMSVRSAIDAFFQHHTHGILWSSPYCVAIWRVAGAPSYYMMEPHSCNGNGLRITYPDDGAACVMTFTSSKAMAYAYLENTPLVERPKHDFHLYTLSVTIQPVKNIGIGISPLLTAPAASKLVPATSKVTIDGIERHADEKDRKHPPGSATCLDAQRATIKKDQEESMKGTRNTSGWLVMNDKTQFLSAQHSMNCKRFSRASRGNQAVACCVMAVAMSRVEDVCRWCGTTIDQVLYSGDQLYQDSYLHYKPSGALLNMQQILRKFYTPGNCVCRVVIFQPRQTGEVGEEMDSKVTEFFREETSGVFMVEDGEFAVALFRTPRGFYMFDPSDRDRYGRAVAPPCFGKARACLSYYPTVKKLVEKLCPNIPPPPTKNDEETATAPAAAAASSGASDSGSSSVGARDSKVHFQGPIPQTFEIYGMIVTSLRRLNTNER